MNLLRAFQQTPTTPRPDRFNPCSLIGRLHFGPLHVGLLPWFEMRDRNNMPGITSASSTRRRTGSEAGVDLLLRVGVSTSTTGSKAAGVDLVDRRGEGSTINISDSLEDKFTTSGPGLNKVGSLCASPLNFLFFGLVTKRMSSRCESSTTTSGPVGIFAPSSFGLFPHLPSEGPPSRTHANLVELKRCSILERKTQRSQLQWHHEFAIQRCLAPALSSRVI